ncbi:endonuclease domain-containing protein [Rhodococcoides fascians]|uniref:endonuclease domain-containing protein n=1 Tax=Rhodococcoides fascians TaxID=1828 RepID=UPI001C919CE4|nr:DUF559 domain-containing protein [Rhodococcus fascians]MBY4013795.1 DUF559 domain-containing protein [Rhodococcus fascians]MBY4020411.1 DUF559 domain-containing protein [Rhodococcus fascians]MDP9635489.1 hypothetical protein [Rhodococcus cercidiphylli]MDQ0281969.1 hypothetical protein [Rhodococcus fascians]
MGIESGPFRGSVAVQSGALSRHRLSRDYVRVFRDTYVPAGTTMDARTLAVAASVCVGNSAIVAGTSAAAMHGARWVDASVPPTVLALKKSHRIPGLILRRDSIEPGDVLVVGGAAVTTPVRTAFDIGRWIPPPQSVIFLDSLVAATGLELDAVSAFASLRPGCRGIRVLLDALGRVDGGAESPQEPRTRLLLIDAGLPKPTTQIDIRHARGRFVARIDMGWERWRVGVEYEGVQHWLDERQRTRDIERYEDLQQCDWHIVRVNSEQLRRRPDEVVRRVRAKLREAGAPV